MHHIGYIIEKCRNRKKMTRHELAEGISTEKYIYMIEKGERTPSCSVLRLLGDRLGVNLSEKFEFMDADEPLIVKKYTELFNHYRSRFQHDLLTATAEEALLWDDFKKAPWKYEININEFWYAILYDNKFEATIGEIDSFLEEIHDDYSCSEYSVNALILQSIAYTALGDMENANKSYMEAQNRVKCNIDSKRYRTLLVNLKINNIVITFRTGRYQDTILEGERLLSLKEEEGVYDRVYYAYFYTSFSYLKLGEYDKAVKNFLTGLYLALVEDLSYDIGFIAIEKEFWLLMDDASVSRELVNSFFERYKLLKKQK